MALETLKGIEKIGGFVVKRVKWNQPDDNHIEVNDQSNAITFKIQDGPVKEKGVNGCQVDTIIETARIMIAGLDKKFSCEDNKMAYNSLCTALWHLDKRKQDREKRGVEGTSKI